MPDPTPDPNPNPAPTPDPNPNPAPADPSVPPNPGPNPPPATPPTDDPAAIKAQLDKTTSEYQEYRTKIDPVLETLYGDSELLKATIAAHNKRLGIAPAADPAVPTDPANPAPAAPPFDQDNRNATVSIIMDKFESDAGIAALPDTEKQATRGMVGQMLKEMLDPKGNKTINQVLEEVSLTKLPWYLDKAYKLINRDNDLKAAIEKGKKEVQDELDGGVGTIGSVPGGSLPIESITLTPKEKEVAGKMGVTEEDYLKNKKALAAARA